MSASSEDKDFSDDDVDPSDVTAAANILRDYFSYDAEERFHLEKAIGAGANGIAWRVKYVDPPVTKRLILKIDRTGVMEGFGGSWDGRATTVDMNGPLQAGTSHLVNERHALKIMRKAKHIVNLVEPEDDPLDADIEELDPHGLTGWLFIEYLENGTLCDFVTNYSERYDEPLPNRILWRFFLCLIRSCIAMAYPPGGQGYNLTETVPLNRRARRVRHGDMHDQNVMFGAFSSGNDVEHHLTPVLKLIDFGEALEFPETPENVYRGEKENVFSVGVLMVELITLDRTEAMDLMSGEGDGVGDYQLRPDLPPIRVAPGFMCPSDDNTDVDYDHVDQDLLGLVMACTAVDATVRPPLAALERQATHAVRTRSHQYYQQREGNFALPESDGTIQEIMQDIIFNARTS
ncbi:uncharacterized protein F4812DRAFT_462735 [Daldinia caldariorum]|uniref:uncharacterized protein n=1 Tax=Daldinia caldariorum TaxID=326644 RepID=UPI002007CC68|nr:uncharacterized protein F4812DRAFT_462735 [Daldinia caldariorum]KAI1464319.1 hypothetical protein F4812DRAFT_462735 [Daldinia caldariorum]